MHFDHTEGRKVQGHQVLELGLVSPKGYLPIDSQIFIGDSKPIFRDGFKDKRSAVAVDYKDAVELDKNEMLRQMLTRAVRGGFDATYILGDSWFGNKGNINAAINLGRIGLFRMKRNNTAYRVNARMLTAKVLYYLKKKKARKIKGLPWKCFAVEVELKLDDVSGEKDHWVKVQLVFTVPADEHSKNYGLFLCTDPNLSKEKILEIYSLRWSIEVYFKEAKQNFGFLREQTGNYVCHYASIHLTAIRYLLFSHRFMQDGDRSFSEVRENTSRKLELLSYANLLWKIFKALINGALDNLVPQIGESVIQTIKSSIDKTVTEFFESALQIDEMSFKVEARAKMNKHQLC